MSVCVSLVREVIFSTPLMVLLPLLGGVDPRLVVLLYAGTASTAFFVAGLSILVSTAAQRGVRAVGEAIALVAAWCILPMLLPGMMPRVLPWLWPWLRPVNEWVLASTPTGVMFAALGAGSGPRLLHSVGGMVLLQLAVGSAFIAWAVARFRAACRAETGEGGRAGARGLGGVWGRLRGRLVPRPPCFEDPVLWKELHTTRPRGLGDVVGLLLAAGLVVLIGQGT